MNKALAGRLLLRRRGFEGKASPIVGRSEAIQLDGLSPTDGRLAARISVGRFGQLNLYSPSGWRVVQDIAASASSIPSQRTGCVVCFVRRCRTAHFSADRRSEVCQPAWPTDHRCSSAASGYSPALPICARVSRHLMRVPTVTEVPGPNHFSSFVLVARQVVRLY